MISIVRAIAVHMRQLLFTFLLPTATAALLAACGGGGGGEAEAQRPASITGNPSDANVTVGGTATFTVVATGDALSYQWQLSSDGGNTWANVADATQASFTVVTAPLSFNGQQWRARVQGAVGDAVISAPARLTVTAAALAPAITAQPASATVNVGETASFFVTATGTDLRYAWEVKRPGSSTWEAQPQVDTGNADLVNPGTADNGTLLRVTVSNSAGSVTSTEALLTVRAASNLPSFSTQPADASVQAPATATFTVAALGSPAPALQWQKSSNGGSTWADIAGATGNTHTTAATALADNGTLFRAVATNSAGSATSATARLTVTSASIAPTITSQPANVTVVAGGTATFTVAASGTPTPTVQWQVSTDGGTTFANINGATAASYTTAALGLAQNGQRFRAVARNSVGTVNSTAALLTVNPAPSALAGRLWATGQALETNDLAVSGSVAEMDDAGRSLVLFTKTDGTREVLYATRGQPGAAGVAPTFSAPVAIDTAQPHWSNPGFGLAMSANGNGVATWLVLGPCNTGTYATTGSNCRFLVTSRYLRASGSWEAPVVVGSTPSSTYSAALINDAGDVMVRYTGWQRVNATGYTNYPAIAWRANGQAAYSQRLFTDAPLPDMRSGMDEAGNMVLAAEATQNSTTDLVVYRGTLAGGFGSQTILDQRGAATTLRGLGVGRNGQVAVIWSQNNGVATVTHAATAQAANGSFTLAELAIAGAVDVMVADDGTVTLHHAQNFDVQRQVGGQWSALQNLPSGLDSFGSEIRTYTRDGSFITVGDGLSSCSDQGGWATYDAASNTTVKAFSRALTTDFILGLSTCNKSVGLTALTLSLSGHALAVFKNRYDILPSPTLPNGDSRTVTNLWGAYFK